MQVAERIVAPVEPLMREDHGIVEMRRIDHIGVRKGRNVLQCINTLIVRMPVYDRSVRLVPPDEADKLGSLLAPDFRRDGGLVQRLKENTVELIAVVPMRQHAPD